MKSSQQLSVALLIDVWFPRYGGSQVHVLNLKQRLKSLYSAEAELFFAGKTHFLIRFFWPLLVISQVIAHHRRQPFDLIHSHGTIAGLPAKIIALTLKIPVIHTVHGSPYLDQSQVHFKTSIESILLTKIKYDAQITVAQSFTKHQNVNQAVVVPNGVNVKMFDAIRTRKYSQPTLIWVGQDIPEKGLRYLKEAVQRVRKKIPTLQTEFVTGGRLTGKDLAKAYKRSHAFVLSSLAEGQPITLLEAWAAKLPVIATAVGDNANLIKTGHNGILVEPENVSQLSKAILKIIRSKKSARRMGEAGYRLVKHRYSWDQVAKKTHAVYQQVLKTHQS